MSGAAAKRQSTEHDLARVRQALKPRADAQAAQQVRACMRDQFPFLGLSAPLWREAVAALQRLRLPVPSPSEAMKHLKRDGPG